MRLRPLLIAACSGRSERGAGGRSGNNRRGGHDRRGRTPGTANNRRGRDDGSGRRDRRIRNDLGLRQTRRRRAFQAMITAFGLERGYYAAIPTPYDPAVPHALVFGSTAATTRPMMRTYLDMEKAPLVSRRSSTAPTGCHRARARARRGT